MDYLYRIIQMGLGEVVLRAIPGGTGIIKLEVKNLFIEEGPTPVFRLITGAGKTAEEAAFEAYKLMRGKFITYINPDTKERTKFIAI